jgi:hypothetical protein
VGRGRDVGDLRRIRRVANTRTQRGALGIEKPDVDVAADEAGMLEQLDQE